MYFFSSQFSEVFFFYFFCLNVANFFILRASPPNKAKKLKAGGSPLTLSKLTARSPTTFYGAKVLKSVKVAAAVPSPVKVVKAAASSSSLLKEVLLANQRGATATPKMTPRGQIRLLAVKTPRSGLKASGARRPLWSEVVAKNKGTQQPTQVSNIRE